MSNPNHELGAWAAAFLRQYHQEDAKSETAPSTEPAAAGAWKYQGITPAASALLESIDAGGVPAFVTSNLLRIAQENGVDVPKNWTPNDIIDALRCLARPA